MEKLKASWVGRLAWVASYVALGHLGIQFTSFPGSWLSLVWLPSGIGMMLVWLYGNRILPVLYVASFLVNAPYILMSKGPASLGSLIVAAILVSGVDTLQSALANVLWRKRPSLKGTWVTTDLLYFLGAVALAATFTCWLLILVDSVFVSGFAKTLPMDFIERVVMLTLTDAHGMFLVVPAVWTFQKAWRTNRRQLLQLLFLPLLLVPISLGRIMPILVTLLLPLLVVFIVRFRFLASAWSMMLIGVSAAILTAYGWSPLPLGAGSIAFVQWCLLVVTIGTPIQLLGVTLEDNFLQQRELEDRVANRTHELTTALRAMESMALTDGLTGLWNRRQMQKTIEAEAIRMQNAGQPICLLSLDLDHFKSINDQSGHRAGDEVLESVSSVIRGLGNGAFASRWGGEEFLILLPGLTLPEAIDHAERIREVVSRSNFWFGARVTVSIGVSQLQAGESIPIWLDRTDSALYRAKRQGRNRVEVDLSNA
ncbi:MAG: diguanylate cyclase [Spirochaetia bacterium]|nr:diguanylate cyclase [Spirochaetia bacterium]